MGGGGLINRVGGVDTPCGLCRISDKGEPQSFTFN